MKNKKEQLILKADLSIEEEEKINKEKYEDKKTKEDDILIKGTKNGSFNRINELTEEVKRFLKQNKTSTTSRGSILVNKELFLETLVDAQVTQHGDSRTNYNFLNERINKKFYNIYNNNYHHYNLQDLASDVQYKIVDHLDGKDTVEINYEGYKKVNDDISYIVYIMDKELNREILEHNYIYYNRDQKEGLDNKYIKPFGDFIYLDHKIDDKYPNYELITDKSYEEYFPSNNEYLETEEEEERLNNIIKKAKLTKRQEEILISLMNNGFNQSKTAREEGMKPKAVHKMVKRIRERFELAFNNPDQISASSTNKDTKQTGIEALDKLLDTDFEYIEILELIKEYINKDQDIEDLFYQVGTIETRKETIRYLKDKKYSKSLVYEHLKAFIIGYYQKY